MQGSREIHLQSDTPRGWCQSCGKVSRGWALIQPGADLNCEKDGCNGRILVVLIKKTREEGIHVGN